MAFVQSVRSLHSCKRIKMAENNEISQNAVKLLFAEDLVNYVMNYTYETTYKAMSAERYRGSIYNAFNETVREAIRLMYSEVHMEIMNFYLVMLHINSIHLSTYTAYAKIISDTYFNDSFNGKDFLHYCARLAGLAMYFYKHGIVEAPNSAIAYIVSALNNTDVTAGWDILNTVSGQILNTKNDTLNQLSQQPTPDKAASVSSSVCNCFIKEYKVQIQKVLAKASHQLSNCSCSLASKDDSKEFENCCPAPFVDSSNFAENKVVNELLSDDIVAPGTSNTTGTPVLTEKDCALDLSLKVINHEKDQNLSPPKGESKSSMLEVPSKSEKHNSDSEENSFPNKISKLC